MSRDSSNIHPTTSFLCAGMDAPAVQDVKGVRRVHRTGREESEIVCKRRRVSCSFLCHRVRHLPSVQGPIRARRGE